MLVVLSIDPDTRTNPEVMKKVLTMVVAILIRKRPHTPWVTGWEGRRMSDWFDGICWYM